jgi:hypothetical protein
MKFHMYNLFTLRYIAEILLKLALSANKTFSTIQMKWSACMYNLDELFTLRYVISHHSDSFICICNDNSKTRYPLCNKWYNWK